jgi:hypothetical protein
VALQSREWVSNENASDSRMGDGKLGQFSLRVQENGADMKLLHAYRLTL